MKEKKGQEPPLIFDNESMINYYKQSVMSKRFYAATKAMQGMFTQGRFDIKNMVKDAYKCADELLSQEN